VNFLRFFQDRIASRQEEPDDAAHGVRVAAAALMVEVVRGDDEFTAVEREAVLGSVQRKFGLDASDAAELLALAESAAREAHDYFQFTSRINESFTDEQKQRLVEELWRVAYADELLHRHEEHLIRRVAELLHLPHSAFIRAKLRAQDA
jgi:uncharacterized tellurite resistance protein B-like protein